MDKSDWTIVALFSLIVIYFGLTSYLSIKILNFRTFRSKLIVHFSWFLSLLIYITIFLAIVCFFDNFVNYSLYLARINPKVNVKPLIMAIQAILLLVSTFCFFVLVPRELITILLNIKYNSRIYSTLFGIGL